MSSHVYSVTHRDSGRTYVGATTQGVETRWRQHVALAARKPKGNLGRAIKRYGVDAFDVVIRAQLPTLEEAQIAERILIALEEPELNSTAGGEGRLGLPGPNHSVEGLARIAAAQRGKTVSIETKAKLSTARKGRPGPKPSEETRVKLSAAQQGNKKMLGKKQSPETRAKISAAMKGNKNRRKNLGGN